jgi:lipid II:glycine glycyltransferase (peptidoglycan interpeptide bridge formation enzyme)
MTKVIHDFRQTDSYGKFMAKSGWNVIDIGNLFKDRERQFAYLWKIPYTKYSYLSLHRINPDIDYVKLDKFCISNNVAVCRMDLNKVDNRRKNHTSYSITDWCSAPSKTRVIDLRKPLPTLLTEMKSKTRYNINLSKKRGIKVVFFGKNINTKYLSDFQKILRVNHEQRNLAEISDTMILDLLESFGSKGYLALAFFQRKVVAGTIFLMSDNIISYTQNSANIIGRKNFAPSQIIWEAIKKGKEIGMTSFDFDGVYDDRNIKCTSSWHGFSKFKEGFGGTEIEYLLPTQKIYFKSDGFINKLEFFWMKTYLKNFEMPSIYPSEIYI